MDYNNQYCKVAAKMLGTEPGLLDYRLVEHLNKIATLVKMLMVNYGVGKSSLLQ